MWFGVLVLDSFDNFLFAGFEGQGNLAFGLLRNLRSESFVPHGWGPVTPSWYRGCIHINCSSHQVAFRASIRGLAFRVASLGDFD